LLSLLSLCFLASLIRYGTTTYVAPPFKVLHTAIMENDPSKIREAAEAEDHPLVIIIPKDWNEAGKERMILKEAGLWLI
jgi:hypothetical protein